MKEVIGNAICNFAFWYDENFLANLTFNEDEWSVLDKVKWKVLNLTYRLACFVLS